MFRDEPLSWWWCRHCQVCSVCGKQIPKGRDDVCPEQPDSFVSQED